MIQHLNSPINYLFRPDGDILYPSHATSCNQTRQINNMKDIEALKDEFRILPVENIIGRHFINESTSGMQMRNMLALELYVSKYKFTEIN